MLKSVRKILESPKENISEEQNFHQKIKTRRQKCDSSKTCQVMHLIHPLPQYLPTGFLAMFQCQLSMPGKQWEEETLGPVSEINILKNIKFMFALTH